MADDQVFFQAPTHNWRAALVRLEGAYSPATLRAYGTDFALFESWCMAAGRAVLPATPETAAAYLADGEAGGAVSTLRRRLSAIGKVHRLLRLPSPTDDEEVRTAFRRAARRRGRRPRQAHGLTAELRERLIAACPEATLAGRRDRALIAVGYDTLCRRAELVALRVADLEPIADGGLTVLVRRSKADPLGDGRTAFVSARTAALLDAWLAAAGIADGPLFRSVVGGRVGADHLYPGSVGRILKRAAHKAGCEPATIAAVSSHSMRVGAAQDMASVDFGILALMAAGGWKSVDVVARYVEGAQVALVGRTREERLRLGGRFGAASKG